MLARSQGFAIRAALVLGLIACGGGGGSEIDGGGGGNPDAPVACDRTQANPCALEPSFGMFAGAGNIGAMTEHVYFHDVGTTAMFRLSGTSSSGTMEFSVHSDPALACADTGMFCTAGQPCSGVDVSLTGGVRYYVKVCNPTAGADLPYNVYLTPQ